MMLEPGALAEIIAANLRAGTALVCHLTTYQQRPELGEVLCRGYLDAYGDDTASVQVLRRLTKLWGGVDPFEVVDVPTDARAVDEIDEVEEVDAPPVPIEVHGNPGDRRDDPAPTPRPNAR